MSKNFILAIDQGTTSTRSVLFDKSANPLATAQKSHRQIYEKAGWVAHDPTEIFNNTVSTIETAINKSSAYRNNIAALGITNQRETLVLWDNKTGEPICDAIVWQCRRSASICKQMEAEGMADLIRERTGLIIDPYFTATKIKWALNNVPEAKRLMDNGRLKAGTIDSFLIYKLSKGKSHITDYTNAARTMLFNIKTGCWDDDILDYFEIDKSILPEVVPSSGFAAQTDKEYFDIPITGIAGDQHASLFGNAAFNLGDAKNTYGTGCFLLKNIGDEIPKKPNKLLTTIAWNIGGKTTYALEGSVFNAGSAIEWLIREMKLVNDVYDINNICNITPDTDGAYFVPAFSGLGAPYWDMYAKGTICGLSLSTKSEHIVRAVMESIAYQSRDLTDHMAEVSDMPITKLKVDGGISRSDFTMQFQADLLGIPVERPKYTETTVLGAAMLAALGAGLFSSIEEIDNIRAIDRVFEPGGAEDMSEKYVFWKKAVERSKGWL